MTMRCGLKKNSFAPFETSPSLNFTRSASLVYNVSLAMKDESSLLTKKCLLSPMSLASLPHQCLSAPML